MSQEGWKPFFTPAFGSPSSPYDYRYGAPFAPDTSISGVGVRWPNGPTLRLLGTRVVAGAGKHRQAGVVNQFTDADRHTGIPTYSRVSYEGVYTGIDVEYYSARGGLEFDFVVHPGADPSQVTFDFPGYAPRLDAGEVVIGRELRLRAPRVFQEEPRRDVAAAYQLGPDGRVGFRLGPYDRGRKLVIDPIAAVALPDEDWWMFRLLLDQDGNRYLVGSLPNGATLGAKFRPDGTMAYLTRIGGPKTDQALDGAVDDQGNLHLVGQFTSANYPGASGLPSGAFLLKLDSVGKLVFSVPVSTRARANSIAIGPDGDLFVVGFILQGLQSQAGVFQPAYGGGLTDGFVARFSQSGRPRWLSFLGSTGEETADDVRIDKAGDLVITGTLVDSPFPGNPLRVPLEREQTFVAKVSADGKQLKFSSRLPFKTMRTTIHTTVTHGLDDAGAIYVAGAVDSSVLPVTPGAYQPFLRGSADIGLVALKPNGATVIYSTYFGGPDFDMLGGIGVDPLGNVTIGGYANVAGTPRGIPATPGYSTGVRGGAFVARFNAAGQLVFSTGSDGIPGLRTAWNVAVDGQGRAHIHGEAVDLETERGRLPGSRRVLARFDPPPPLALRLVSGDRQRGTIDEMTPLPLTVEVRDAAGNPKPGIDVVFKGDRPNSRPAVARSDALGIAGIPVLLDAAGEIRFLASATGVQEPVVFTQTADRRFSLQVFQAESGTLPAPRRYRATRFAGVPGRKLPAGSAPESEVPANQALLCDPEAVLAGSRGELYIADFESNSVRMVNRDGIITTVAGGPTGALKRPSSLAFHPNGGLMVGDDAQLWCMQDVPNRTPVALLPASKYARAIWGIGVDSLSRIHWVESTSARYFRMPGESPETVAGSPGGWGGGGDGEAAIHARFSFPRGLVFDRAGNMYLCDALNHRVRRVDTAGMITTVAGDGSKGFSGDGEPAIRAQLNTPLGLAIDGDDNIFIADTGNARIRLLTPGGRIYTVAGSGVESVTTDAIPALSARFASPTSVTVAANGDLYVADAYFNAIYKLAADSSATDRSLVSNAASFQTGNLAPDEIIYLGPGRPADLRVTLKDSAGNEFELPPIPSGDRVLFRVPSKVSTGAAVLAIRDAETETELNVSVGSVAPGIYTAGEDGTGPPKENFVVRRPDSDDVYLSAYECDAGKCRPKAIDLSDPAAGVYLLLTGTGMRKATADDVEAWIGGRPAKVVSLSPLPDVDGQEQLVLELPSGLSGAGLLEVVVSVGGLPANPVWIESVSDPAAAPFLWDFHRNADGWMRYNVRAGRVEAGLWHLEPEKDPYIEGPRVAADARIYRYVQVRMSAACQGRGQVFFMNDGDSYYTGEKLVNFDSKACPACASPPPFTRHVIDMSSHPKWAGTITAIRIDPCDGRGPDSGANKVLIDSIRLSPKP